MPEPPEDGWPDWVKQKCMLLGDSTLSMASTIYQKGPAKRRRRTGASSRGVARRATLRAKQRRATQHKAIASQLAGSASTSAPSKVSDDGRAFSRLIATAAAEKVRIRKGGAVAASNSPSPGTGNRRRRSSVNRLRALQFLAQKEALPAAELPTSAGEQSPQRDTSGERSVPAPRKQRPSAGPGGLGASLGKYRKGQQVQIIFGKHKGVQGTVADAGKTAKRWIIRLSSSGKCLEYPDYKFKRLKNAAPRSLRRSSAKSVADDELDANTDLLLGLIGGGDAAPAPAAAKRRSEAAGPRPASRNSLVSSSSDDELDANADLLLGLLACPSPGVPTLRPVARSNGLVCATPQAIGTL